MDGNGRWAQKRGLARTEGHRAGEEALFETCCAAVALGLPWFTVYAFSTENWRRPHEEVRFLLSIIAENLLTNRRDQLHEMGVRIRFIGRRDWRVPRWVLRKMDAAAELTRNNQGTTLTVAFNYGGRAELIDAVRELVNAGTPARKINEKAIRAHLYAPDMPDPDMVIRTSGEYRVSNFMIWELAYSELIFTDVMWPDFSGEHLREAIREYQRRDRRFGATHDFTDVDPL